MASELRVPVEFHAAPLALAGVVRDTVGVDLDEHPWEVSRPDDVRRPAGGSPGGGVASGSSRAPRSGGVRSPGDT